MSIEIGKTALITTDNWFVAPDGMQYRSVFGTVKGVKTDSETLGIKTNRGSTNWYVEIGNMTLAGCQIHYAIQTDKFTSGPVMDRNETGGITKDFERLSLIFNADEPT